MVKHESLSDFPQCNLGIVSQPIQRQERSKRKQTDQQQESKQKQALICDALLHGLKSLQESRSVAVVGVDLETRYSRSSPQFSVVVTLQGR